MKTSTPAVAFTFALVCFGLAPFAQAVSPPPDGDYPGGNTAEENTATGALALYSNFSGIANTAVGSDALPSNNSGATTHSPRTSLFRAAIIGK